MPLPPLRFDNAFLRELPGDPDAGPGIRQVHGALWSRVDPEPVALPRLLAHSQEIAERSDEHTSELQSLMRISYAVFCLKKKKNNKTIDTNHNLEHSNTNHN